eukprot:m.279609 g.279609  ORF g.279609 m.279609 type:complete len:574 (-) comp102884_c0_seq1:13-1734(-)
MWVHVDSFDTAYQQIKKNSLSGESTVLIFVAPDVDALCACNILTTNLKSDFVSYKIVPVESYDDLLVEFESFAETGEELKSVVFLNCGGTMPLAQLLDDKLETDFFEYGALYVIDSHRPLHLENIFHPRINVFDDGETSEEAPRREQLDDSDSEGEESPDSPKRRRTSSPSSGKKTREEILEEYYASSYYGVSAAVLMWKLARDIGRKGNTQLWLAVVGLSDQLHHDRIDSALYYEHVQNLQQDVLNLNGDVEDQSSGLEFKIKSSQELRFFLLRHWSLYDSMISSRYVITRLRAWRTKGESRIKNLFAKMGISLEQSKQNYTAMGIGLRDRLFSELELHAAHYGLFDYKYASFVNVTENKKEISANDVVCAVSAILSRPNDTDSWKNNFFEAFDALQPNRRDLIKKGIALAMKQEAALLRQIPITVEFNSLKRLKGFRYALIKESPDQKYLNNILNLSHLGSVLLDVLEFDDTKTRRPLPLLLGANRRDRDDNENYVIVGCWSNSLRKDGGQVKNYFTECFEDVIANYDDLRLRKSFFQSSVVEVHEESVIKFLMGVRHYFHRTEGYTLARP